MLFPRPKALLPTMHKTAVLRGHGPSIIRLYLKFRVALPRPAHGKLNFDPGAPNDIFRFSQPRNTTNHFQIL